MFKVDGWYYLNAAEGGTAEGHAFRRDELNQLLDYAAKGIGELLAAQREALAG